MTDEIAALKARVIALEGMVEVLLRRLIDGMSYEEALSIRQDIIIDGQSGRHFRPPPRWEVVAKTINLRRQPDE